MILRYFRYGKENRWCFLCCKRDRPHILDEFRNTLVRPLLDFGSYARGDVTPDSDLDVIIVGGKNFVPRNIFALAEDLRELIGRDADVFEIREVNAGTPFYESVMREGVRIA